MTSSVAYPPKRIALVALGLSSVIFFVLWRELGIIAAANPMSHASLQPCTPHSTDALPPASMDDPRPLRAVKEGASNWTQDLLTLSNPDCQNYNYTATLPPTTTRTGFMSFPRSGNSYVRSLVEATSGYQTSSIYCDPILLKTFLGECNHANKFMIKVSSAKCQL